MVFGKFAEIFSAAANRLSAPKSSNAAYVSPSPGLPPLSGSNRGYGLASTGLRNKLRLSSSLQDFSAYQKLDIEEGNNGPDLQKNSVIPTEANPLNNENIGSSFSKEKGVPAASERKKWIRVSVVLLCLVLFAFLVYVSQYMYFSWSQGPAKYYVVLDCGSTGTRVFVYQASVNGDSENNLPIALKSLPEGLPKSGSQSGRAYNRMETEPGFDKLVHNRSGLRHAIKPLIRWAEKQIPKQDHKSTSLFMYATAGVRRLPSSDSKWLLDNAWSILKGSSFSCKKEWVKVITGMEEAYFGWVALNYHTGVLGAMPRKETFGALDLGGSSLQITFETKDGTQDETSLKLGIGPVNHHLSAYSLAGYGLNDAFDKSVSHLLKKLSKTGDTDLVGGNIKVKHPCLHSGYEAEYSCSLCASLYPEGETPPMGQTKFEKGGKPKVPILLVGDPKWDECSALAKVAVNLSEWSDQNSGVDCELQPCALASSQPQPRGKFYAMSGFYVVYRFFNLGADAALDDVLEKGKAFCEKTWDVAKTSVAPQPFIEQYCFRAPYVVSLLRQGLHIPEKNVNVGSGSITWTLGAAILEAGKAVSNGLEFHSYEIFQMKINPFALFSILSISLLVLILALSCIGKRTPKVFRKQYLPLFNPNAASASSVLRLHRWSPINLGEGRGKTPLSPTVVDAAQQSPFEIGRGFSNGGVQLTESTAYHTSSGSVSHSYSASSLGQIQYDSNRAMNSFWPPHRQQRLQSRRSQSREDLNSSVADAHLVKT